ncbi:hypothetical protein ACWIG5_38695 [Streptomyces lydicus]
MKKVILLSVLCVALALAGGGFLLYRAIDSGAITGGSAERTELIGSWHAPDGAQVTLRKDGTAEGVKIPGHFSDDERPQNPITGEGKWTLGKRRTFVDQEITVVLNTGPGKRSTIEFRIVDKGARGGIYRPISVESSSVFVFTKSY